MEQPRPLTRAERRRAAQAAAVPEQTAEPLPPAAGSAAGFAIKVAAEALAAAELAGRASASAPEPPRSAAEVAEPAADDVLFARAPYEGALPGLEAPVAEPGVDQFASAARLFSFTGEVPTAAPAGSGADEDAVADPPAPEAPEAPAADAVVRGRRLSVKRVAAASFSVGILGIVGLLTVGMTTAPQAVAAANSAANTTSNLVVAGDVAPGGKDQIQAYVAPATVQNSGLDRSDYSTGSIAASAASLGITRTSNFFVNNPNSAIQWPFAIGVPISYGFGWRTDSDTGTEFHEGADFTPGEGAHVQAIADGTVRIATEAGGAYGVTVVLDHQIDGQLVSTRYAHMLVGSLQVKVGDHVKVGQYLGRTGDTGFSFGAHTHVEVLLNGTTAVDPIAWLRQHAGG